MESAHHSSSKPDYISTSEVPSLILRTALSAIPFISDLCGVDVQWFQVNSSQDCQIPMNCQCKGLLVSWSAPRTSASSFPSSWEVVVLHGYDCVHWVAKSCVTTSYRWLFRDSHPSLRTLWSAVVKSPKFPLWARLYQCVSCKEPLQFWFAQADIATSVFWEVSKNTVLPWWHFGRPFRIWVMRSVCGRRHFCIFEIICELLQPFWKISQKVIRIIRIPCGIPRPVSWCELVTSLRSWTCWCTWWCTWRVLRGRCRGRTRQSRNDHRYEIFRLHKMFFLVWSTVAVYRWPFVGVSVFLSQSFPNDRTAGVSSRFALSRRDPDRERILVLPRSFAPLHWPLPPLWGSWISASIHFIWVQSLLLSTCIDARSQPRILFPLVILKWVPALPWLQWESRT